MNKIDEFIKKITDPTQRERLEGIIHSIRETFPELEEDVKWNQPMFIHHKTFIIAFSLAKAHIAVAPESVVIKHFKDELDKAGYVSTQGMFRIKWSDPVDLDLLHRIVSYNMETKKDYSKFWR